MAFSRCPKPRSTPRKNAPGLIDPAHSLLVTDIDGTLVLEGIHQPGLEELKALLAARGGRYLFAVATGRNVDQIRQVLGDYGIPSPDIVISDVGTAVRYGITAEPDPSWAEHLNRGWDRRQVHSLLRKVPGIRLQGREGQGPFKLSFYLEPRFDRQVFDAAIAPHRRRISVVFSQNTYLDVLPARASKGQAVQYLCRKWAIPAERTLVCGDSGNDLDMLTGYGQGVVVANHAPDLEVLHGDPGVFIAPHEAAAGILDGMRHFRFAESNEPPLQ
jgi:sucrose-phosphate synthase